MQICIAAGEVSGDQILASILSRFSEKIPAIYSGIVGSRLIEVGAYPLFPMERLSVMGVMEVLPRISDILSIQREMKNYLVASKPSALITCDAPDFNLPLCGYAKKLGIPAIHVVSPSVWAWRRNRVPKIAKQLDALVCVFPFEPSLYAHTGLRCKYIGHPLASEINFNPDPVSYRAALGLPTEGSVLGILPGSRVSEVKRLLPLFLKTFDQLVVESPSLVGVIPAVNETIHKIIEEIVGTKPCFIIQGKSRQVMAASTAVLVASGTAALESVLTGRPTVAAYQMNPFTYGLIKGRLKTEFVTLPNFLANRALIPELIQNNATPDAIIRVLRPGLFEGASSDFLKQAQIIHDSLSGPANNCAAEFIKEILE